MMAEGQTKSEEHSKEDLAVLKAEAAAWRRMCSMQVRAATGAADHADDMHSSGSRTKPATSASTSSHSVADVVTLNVGGKLFTTTRSTLCHFEGSRLEAMFSGRWDASLPRDSAGNPFIDRDPEFFGVILNMLRDLDAAGGHFASEAEAEAEIAAVLAARGIAAGEGTGRDGAEVERRNGLESSSGPGIEAEEQDGRGVSLHGGYEQDAGTAVTIDVPPEERGRFVRELDWYHLTEYVYGEPLKNSHILSRDARLQLFHMFDGTSHAGEQWELLYRGTTHGMTAEQFHARCDDAGPSVVLLRTDLNCVFGGYYDGSWSPARHTNLAKSRSFLFIFETLRGSCAHKLRVDADPAGEPIVCYDPAFGPLFGVYVPRKRRRATRRHRHEGEGSRIRATFQRDGGGSERDPSADSTDEEGAWADATEGAGGIEGSAQAPAIQNAICAMHRINPKLGFATLGTPGCPYESPPGWRDCRHITGTASGQFVLGEIEVYGIRGAVERREARDMARGAAAESGDPAAGGGGGGGSRTRADPSGDSGEGEGAGSGARIGSGETREGGVI